jgi:hexulose-6-phosphate isomerase
MVDIPPIGIIQGRLTSSPNGRLQFFPKNNWRNEFPLAQKIGLAAIEPILETDDFLDNPLLNEAEIEELKMLSQRYQVAVVSCCGDIFMDYPLHRETGDRLELAVMILDRLIANCARVGIKTILMPILERSEIRSESEKSQLRSVLSGFLGKVEKAGISFAFESSLPGLELKELVESFKHSNVKVYYDIGNAVSYGFDVPREIRILGGLIGGVHVKDRKVGSSVSVPLGTGDASFPDIFAVLREVNYRECLILQAARDVNDCFLENAERNLNFVRAAWLR